ncbi:MAG: Maf family protein [Halofilum sp. (in: g-proteobacteria)]
MTAQRLILASTSPYRRELLERLRVSFTTVSPDCDETPRPGEKPAELVTRLARDKAASVARRERDALVIGSDQVAALGERILTKPGDRPTAFEQLRASSGASVVFHTGLTVIDSTTGREDSACVEYTVDFRELGDDEIERYLTTEEPWDCAGSIRSEGYGIVLFRGLRGDDPTALIGLPLIRLRTLLSDFGWPLP